MCPSYGHPAASVLADNLNRRRPSTSRPRSDGRGLALFYDPGMPQYWTILVQEIAYTPTGALGLYETREAAESGITPAMASAGAYVVPLTTGFTICVDAG